MTVPSLLNKIIYKIIGLSIVIVLVYALLLICGCKYQVLAANSNPAMGNNKSIITAGILVYILIMDYRILSVLITTVPYRKSMVSGTIGVLMRRDLKYVVLPVIIISTIIFAGYAYILYSSRRPDVYMYVYYSAASTIALEVLSVYVLIFGIPATIMRGWKRILIAGLSASILSGVASLILLALSAVMPYYVWLCRAADYGIRVVNPNTGVFESSFSVSFTRSLGDLVGYTIYSYMLYYLIRRLGSKPHGTPIVKEASRSI